MNRYPHYRYLQYLITKRFTGAEVEAECDRLGLLNPSTILYEELRDSVEPLPACWEPTLTRGNVQFFRWLRDVGVLDFWRKASPAELARDILQARSLREAIETLFMLHEKEHLVSTELRRSYPPDIVPSDSVISMFRHYFWDFTSLTLGDRLSYVVEVHKPGEENRRPDLWAAWCKEPYQAYAVSGLRPPKVGVELFEGALVSAHMMNLKIQREGGASGATMAGVAALQAAAYKARDIIATDFSTADGGGSDIRKRAALFMVKRDLELPRIMSIDEVSSEEENSAGVIDAEPGNVHQLVFRD